MQDRTVAFEDEQIAVELLYFAAHSGTAQVTVHEKHDRVGFYYIWVNFTSGDSTRIDYDGGNPNRVQALEVPWNEIDDLEREFRTTWAVAEKETIWKLVKEHA